MPFGLAAALTLPLFSHAAAKAPNCTVAQATSADKWLWPNERDKRLSLEQNLPWGTPRSATLNTSEHLFVHWYYIVGYDDLRVPLCTGKRVVGKILGNTTRFDCFRVDPRLAETVASTPDDYDEPGAPSRSCIP